MWHGLVWGVVGLLVALWSAVCWAVHALLSGGVGAIGDAGVPWPEQWHIPLWLADWLPMAAITTLKTLLTVWGPWLAEQLAALPGLLAWLTPLLWLVWGLGTLMLAGCGLVGSVAVAAVRRDGRRPAAAAG
jgi:hypothetical protein